MKKEITVNTNKPTKEQKDLIMENIKKYLESQYNKEGE